MAYSTPAKAVVGYTYDEDDFNTEIRDNFLAKVPAIFTAKGDLAVATGSKAGARLAAGSNGEILTANSAEASGLEWVGGKVHIGMIIIWSGSTGAIPSGWQLCNGTNGTPDLRDRFVVGAGSTYSVDASGGAATRDLEHNHTVNDLTSGGSHTHTRTHASAQAHSHDTGGGNTGGPSATADEGTGSNTLPTGTHTHSVAADTTGGGHSHTLPTTDSGGSHTHGVTVANELSTTQDTLPRYYALAFIQRLT